MCGGKSPLLCSICSGLNEVDELKKVIRERVFDASNEGELTMEQIDIPFKKDDTKRTRS